MSGIRQPESVVVFRKASADDELFLQAMLAEAADWRRRTVARAAREVLCDSAIAHYVVNWPQNGDFGVVAVDGGESIGAVWCRLFDPETPGYGFVAPDIPELSIGVVATRRRQGIGRRLLEELFLYAQHLQIKQVSLSVEVENPAIGLYADVGFVEVSSIGNSRTMMITFLEAKRVGQI